MIRHVPSHSPEEERLGTLAMRFRGARDPQERNEIVQEYRRTILKLIDCGCWDRVPPPDDQLPDEFMPPEYERHWSNANP